MRAIPVIWCDRTVGSISAPDSFRPPMTEQEVATFASLIIRSRSWIFDLRPGDYHIEEADGAFRVRFTHRLGPGDLGCLAGFVPAADCQEFVVDESLIEMADQVLREHGSRAL